MALSTNELGHYVSSNDSAGNILTSTLRQEQLFRMGFIFEAVAAQALFFGVNYTSAFSQKSGVVLRFEKDTKEN